jgi:uncharacterized phiE125 gp8 family phage protein
VAFPVLVTPASVLPVTREQVKLFCAIRLEETQFDALLDLLLAGAVSHAEAFLGRALGEQTWRLTLDAFSDAIELAVTPVLPPVVVNYSDPDGLPQVVDSGDYTLDLSGNPGWVVINSDAEWPETIDAVNAVWIDFDAGWTAATLPPGILSALCQAVAAQLDARSDPGRAGAALKTMETALLPWRRIRI